MTISSFLRLLFNFRHLHFSGKYKQRRYWATKISQQNRENLLKFKKQNCCPTQKFHSETGRRIFVEILKNIFAATPKISQQNRWKDIFWNLKKNICRHTKDCFAKMDKEETKTSEMKFVKGIMRSGPTGWLFLNYTPPPPKKKKKKGGREPKKHPVILENIIFISQRVYYHLYLHWLASLSFDNAKISKIYRSF